MQPLVKNKLEPSVPIYYFMKKKEKKFEPDGRAQSWRNKKWSNLSIGVRKREIYENHLSLDGRVACGPYTYMRFVSRFTDKLCN